MSRNTTERDRNWRREHALLDDNGDRLGTPPDWFRGVRATRRAKEGVLRRRHPRPSGPPDPQRSRAEIPAEVRRRRDELELAIAALRDQKGKLGEDEYYKRLKHSCSIWGGCIARPTHYRRAASPGNHEEPAYSWRTDRIHDAFSKGYPARRREDSGQSES